MKRVIFSVVICLMLLAMALPAYADTTYVVKPGDSLSKIALQFGVSTQAIVTANGLANPNLLWVGQKLIIPAPGTVPVAPVQGSAPAGVTVGQTTYKVQSTDTLYKISRQHGVSLAALMAANGLTTYVIYTGQVLTIPAPGTTAPAAAPTATPPVAAPSAPVGPINNVFRGLHGLAFSIENRSVHAGDDIWFDFTVANQSDSGEGYAVLSIHSDSGISGQSWTNRTFYPWTTLSWRDRIHIDQAGLYPFYLGICYGSVADCMADRSPWQRLSPNITVAVDTPLPVSGYSSNGVRGDYFYVEDMLPSTQNEIWFDFGVTNTNTWDVPYGALSVVVVQTTTGASWTESTLKGGQVLTWRDHIRNLNVGTYAFYLGICYADKNECAQNQALWSRLSDNVYVTVSEQP
jgi:LysM repeat protein